MESAPKALLHIAREAKFTDTPWIAADLEEAARTVREHLAAASMPRMTHSTRRFYETQARAELERALTLARRHGLRA